MNDQRSLSGNVILPPIGNSALTASSLKVLNEQRKRTIETEFGTIIIDGQQLVVRSDTANPPTSLGSAVTLQEPGDVHRKESVVQTPELPGSPTERLAATLTFEQGRRQGDGMWTTDCEMMLFALSSFMGLSCAIRGPRLWMQFGGGAFLVASAAWHVVITTPFLLLEAALGQFTGHGVAGFMPQMAPALRGYPNALLFCLVVTVVSWMANVSTLGIYLVEALHHQPCWVSCNASFNTERCYTYSLDQSCQDRGALLFAAGRCVRREELCRLSNGTSHLPRVLDDLATACVHLANGSTWLNGSVLAESRELAAAEYFYDVRHTDDDSGHRIHAHGREMLSLLACWMLLALLSQAGLEFVCYTLPLLLGLPGCICIALIVREMMVGRNFSVICNYVVTSLEHLADYRCWLFAATWSLRSPNIGIGLNSLIYARNPPKHNFQRSVVTLIAINFTVRTLWHLCSTIIMARHAMDTGKELGKDLVRDFGGDPDLIMLTSWMGSAGDTQVWLALLLLLAILLAIGTAQAGVLTIETTLREISVLTTMTTRSAVCLICSAGFMLDMLFSVIPGSPHVYTALSTYAQGYFNIVLALVMVAAVNVTLGVDRLLDGLSQIVPLRRTRWFWALCWKCLCPLTLLGMFVSNVWHHATHPLRFRDAPPPGWTAALAVALAVSPLLLLLVGVFRAYTDVRRGGDDERLYRPTERWRVGLHSPETYAAAAGLSSGRGGASAAKSLMTWIYGAVSSRSLFAKGSLSRLESRIVPIVAGSGVQEAAPIDTRASIQKTEPAMVDGGAGGFESKMARNCESPKGLSRNRDGVME